MPGVIGTLLVLANTFGTEFQFPCVPLVNTAPWHAEGFPVLQTDWIDQHQLLGLRGVLQCIAGTQHAAGGVADDAGLVHPEAVEQGMGISRQLLKAVLITGRFARGAKTDLVRRHDPVTRRAQGLDAVAPGGCAEVFAVQQHRRMAIGRPRGGNVHVAHLQGLALGIKVEVMQRVRVLEALQLLAINRGGSGRRRQRLQGQAAGQYQA